jgi:hypothetical protein
MYKIETGEVFVYESEVGQFVKVGASAPTTGGNVAAGRRQRDGRAQAARLAKR